MKPHLEAIVFETPSEEETEVANVAIWRNQVVNTTDYAGPYPAIFVEFLSSTYTDGNSKAFQLYEPVIRLHLCFPTTEAEADTLAIFNFANAVYSAMQLKQYGTFAPMKRRAEDTVFNYGPVQDYMQDYSLGTAKDYAADKRPSRLVTITDIDIQPDLTNNIDG